MNLIFLPGASGNTDFWRPVMEKLTVKGHKEVIAYPEFGGHCPHPGVDSFQNLQEYVLDQLDWGTVVIAQSMGGIFAVQAALQKPEHIKALVLVATSGGIDLSPFHVADWRADYQLNFSVPDWFVQHQSVLDEQLSQIDCPVLLIWGDSDPISPVTVGQYLHGKMVCSELLVIKQGQHDLANVYADQVSWYIQQFLTQLMK